MARLQEQYENKLKVQIQKTLGGNNLMEVPRIKKITLNMGVGEAVADKKVLQNAVINIERKNYVKNRLNCTYCKFHKTEYCT